MYHLFFCVTNIKEQTGDVAIFTNFEDKNVDNVAVIANSDAKNDAN